MSGKKRLIGLFIIFLILIIIAWFLSVILVFFLENGLAKELSMKNMYPFFFEKRVLIITGLAAILILIGIGYYAFKYKLFNFNSLINKVQRAKSNVHGNARWLENWEMTDLFGAGKTTIKRKKIKVMQETFYEEDDKGNIIKSGGGLIEREEPIRIIKPFHKDYVYSEIGISKSEFEGYVVKSYIKNNRLYVQCYSRDHALIVGTSGTGKSAYFISPTIQANARSYKKPSMVINDLKGELFDSHSKLLKQMGYEVICINIKTPRQSIRYNPMGFIWDLYHEYLETNDGQLIDKCNQQITQLAETFCPMPEGGGGQNSEFYQAGQNIIKGIIWAMLEDSEIEEFGWTKNKFTIMQIVNIVNQPQDYFLDFLKKRHKKNDSRVPRLTSQITENASANLLSSYLSTVKTAMGKYVDEGIEYLTSASDFDLKKISDKPTAIFLIIPEEKERFVLATMIISQLYQYLVLLSDKNNGTLKRAWYFLLDEFGNMPKINNLKQIITLARSRNIWCCLVVQSLSMIKSTYGNEDATTIIDGCHMQLLLGSNELETNKHFQEQFGTYTVYSRTASINDKTLGGEYSGSTSLTTKHLVELDELYSYSNRLGSFYFKISGQFPAKSNIIPFFNSYLLSNGTFVKGNIKNDIHEVKDYKNFYDLVNRYEIARWKYYDYLNYREDDIEIAKQDGKAVPSPDYYPPRPDCLNNFTSPNEDNDDTDDVNNPPNNPGSNNGNSSGGRSMSNPQNETNIKNQQNNSMTIIGENGDIIETMDDEEIEEPIVDTTRENTVPKSLEDRADIKAKLFFNQLAGIVDDAVLTNTKEALKNNKENNEKEMSI